MLRQLSMTLNFYQVSEFSLFHSSRLFCSQTSRLLNIADSIFKTFPYILPKWINTNAIKTTQNNSLKYINFTLNLPLKNAYNALQALNSPQLSCFLNDYQAFKYSKDSDTNPSDQTNTFYQWAVKFDLTSAEIRLLIIDCYKFEGVSLWSAARVRQSKTKLTDGRVVLIGGEYNEPFDYSLYSDVIVIYPEGEVKVYNYPQKIFNCPESHSATLVGTGFDESIIIIGSSSEHTAVYQLNTQDFKIRQLITRNSMGWIQGHTAVLKNHHILVDDNERLVEDSSLLVDNIDTWSLNLNTLIWKNLTHNHRYWQHFYVVSQDYDSIHLQDYHALNSYFTLNEIEAAANQVALLKMYCNINPDIDSYRQLFCPPIDHEIVMDSDAIEDIHAYSENIAFADYQNHTLYIDGIKVRYKADIYHIQVIVEGKLSEDKLELLQQNLRHKLSKIENMACEVIEI